jgi:hypothetical protein
MDSRAGLSEKRINLKSVLQIMSAVFLVDKYMYISIFIGLIFIIISTFFINIVFNTFFLIISIIFSLIGIIFLYNKSPAFSIAYFLFVIFLISVTAGMMYPTEKYQIIGVGLTLLLVILTFWYASTMLHQIKIMNNEKLGKVIGEIARSIFSPLRDELFEIKGLLNSGYYISHLYHPTTLKFGKHGKDVVNHYINGEIEIYPKSYSSEDKKPINRLAYRLLKIEDEDLKYLLFILNGKNKEFVKIIDEMNALFNELDGDLIPFWIPFKEECEKLIQSPQNSKPYLNTDFDEFDLEMILKHSLIQQDYHLSVPFVIPGKQGELPRFISENKEKIFVWLTHNPALKNDIENIEKKKKMLIENIDEMLGEINYLLSTWKITYYLAEEELQMLEGVSVV